MIHRKHIHKLKRSIHARYLGHRIVHPKDLISPFRLDVAAKTIFARAYLEGNTSTWPEEIYKAHLEAWNGFYEEYPVKSSYNDFKKAFTAMLDDFQSSTFKHHESPIIIGSNGRLRNGAHRLSSSIVTNQLVNTVVDVDSAPGDWNYEYFRNSQKSGIKSDLEDIYLDAMTVEYVSLVPDRVYAVLFFPVAQKKRHDAEEILKTHGEIINVKHIPKEYLNGESVIRQLYLGEKWNNDQNIEAIKHKAKGCFSGAEDLSVYIIRSSMSEFERRILKEELRDMWGVDKHSIHISDTVEEAHRITRMFFHDQSLRTLSLQRDNEFPDHFTKLFHLYQSLVPTDLVLRDKVCIDSSGTLAVLGIRDANDIDYLHRGVDCVGIGEDISSHNEHAHWYADSIDDIITDPRKHFYYNGLKFASLDVVRAMKVRRGEEKDRMDVILIDEFKRKNIRF